jgi:hypothetical protein
MLDGGVLIVIKNYVIIIATQMVFVIMGLVFVIKVILIKKIKDGQENFAM